MKRKSATAIAATLSLVLAAAGLGGCSASGQDSSAQGENVRLMVWSPSGDQSKDTGE